MTPQPTPASVPPPPSCSITASDGWSFPGWAWEAAADLSFGQIIAALSAAGTLPDHRETTDEQIRALVAIGLARLGHPGLRELDARLRHLTELGTANDTDPQVSYAAYSTRIRLLGGTRSTADNCVALAYRWATASTD